MKQASAGWLLNKSGQAVKGQQTVQTAQPAGGIKSQGIRIISDDQKRGCSLHQSERSEQQATRAGRSGKEREGSRSTERLHQYDAEAARKRATSKEVATCMTTDAPQRSEGSGGRLAEA